MHAGQAARVRDLGVKYDRRNLRQVIDPRLRHRCSRICAQDQRRVVVPPDQQVHGRKLAGVEPRIAATHVNSEGIPGRVAQDHVRSRHIAMPPHRHRHELGKRVHFRRQRQDGRGVHVLAARHRHAHAEEYDAEPGTLHPVHQVLQLLDRQPGFRNALGVHRLILDKGAQRGNDLEILAWPNLEKDVRRLFAGGLADVQEDTSPNTPSCGPCGPWAGTCPSA